MKLTSVTSVTFAACGGSARSSLRAAYSPPKPPPRITTFQAMAGCYARDELRRTARRSRCRPRSSRRRAGPRRRTRPASSAASAQAPRRLGDGLHALEQEPHRGDDLRRRTPRRPRRRARGSPANVSSPGIGSCWPSAIVRGTGIRTRSPAASERRVVVARLGLDADDAHAVEQRLGGRRAARDQPAAADADQQHVERPGLLDQLERHRALAGHHALVVVRMDRDEPALGDELGEQLLAVLRRSGRSGSPRRRGPRWRRACRAARRRASGSRRARRAAARRARAPARGCPTRRSRRRARAPASVSDATALYAPRNLKAPTRWRFSAFRNTVAPVASSSAREVSTGVRCATPLDPPRGGPDVLERIIGSSRMAVQPSPVAARLRRRPRARERRRHLVAPRRARRPETISRSGGRSIRAATSSSSGRTRLAVTVGAHGPGSRRRSQRETSTSTPLSRAAARVAATDAALDVARQHRREAEPRGGDREHARAAAPVGQRAAAARRPSAARATAASSGARRSRTPAPGSITTSSAPGRAASHGGRTRSAPDVRRGRCQSRQRTSQSSPTSVVETSTSAPPAAARRSRRGPAARPERRRSRTRPCRRRRRAPRGRRARARASSASTELGLVARDADREPDHASATAAHSPSSAAPVDLAQRRVDAATTSSASRAQQPRGDAAARAAARAAAAMSAMQRRA